MLITTENEIRAKKSFSELIEPSNSNGEFKCVRIEKREERKGQDREDAIDFFSDYPADTNYVFDARAIELLSKGLENLAKKTGEGEFLAYLQRSDMYERLEDRFLEVSEQVNRMRVFAKGLSPETMENIDFVPIFHKELERFWIILFASDKANGVLICRQANDEEIFEKKLFTGFYSFNPFLVHSIKRGLLLVPVGLDGVVENWKNGLEMPSLSEDQINDYLARA